MTHTHTHTHIHTHTHRHPSTQTYTHTHSDTHTFLHTKVNLEFSLYGYFLIFIDMNLNIGREIVSIKKCFTLYIRVSNTQV